jgi:glutamate--cysteine ligase
VAQLQRIFQSAGLNVRVGSIDPAIKKTTRSSCHRRDRDAGAGGAQQAPPGPEELRSLHHPAEQRPLGGRPGILEDLHEQYLLPPLHAGWSVRRKSRHFQSYEEVSKRFGKMLGIDPWLVNPMFNRCGELDFLKEEGMDCLRTNADALLAKIRKKYKEYGINEKPFVIVKADNGTTARAS